MYLKTLGRFSARVAFVSAALLFIAPFAQATENLVSNRDPLPTRPGSFALKLETGLAIPLTDPQSRVFDMGGDITLKGLFALTPYLDLGPSVTFLALPTDDSQRNLGTAWTFGGSIQLKRPHDRPYGDKYFAISPWVDADILYVRTGELNRPGFAFGAGLAIPIGESRIFWLGPFVRYLQVIQPKKSGFDNHDAKVFTLGISLEIGSGVRRAPEAVAVPEAVVNVVTENIPYCPDRDNDGVPDVVDRCPDVKGTQDNWGCPQYKRLVVKPDKIELTEKLYFAWDQAVIQDVSFPVLDEVVQLLNENKGLRVQVEGHSSSEGEVDHNQTLSQDRADAVLDYLVTHGIAKERLVSEGFGSSVPADTNATVEGRENNRRVEFMVHLVILKEGSK
jgi:outer membrane protein OmpA-like peptidoglycan-associated protein